MKKYPKISVIIPTYNRAKILNECLDKLINQDFDKENYEIIIIDDGSSDNTKEVVENTKKDTDVQIKYLYQKNQGQGIARNYGIRFAKGEILIFIGDDIIAVDDFIKEHDDFHNLHPEINEAVLGFIGWDPRLEITPFMEWLTNGSSVLGKFGGHQFAFEKLKGKKLANYNFFYTSNISLKKELIKRNPFDSRFSSYGWEDIELGYRLEKKADLKIYYNPRAIVYHYHPMDLKDLEKRMFYIGKSAHLINEKYPELKKVPKNFKLFILKILSSTIVLKFLQFIKKISKDRIYSLYYYAISKKYFLQGLKKSN